MQNNTHPFTMPQAVPSNGIASIVFFIQKGIIALNAWVERNRLRNELMAVDDRLLNDIGITRLEISQI